MELYEAIRTRRDVRHFLADPIPEEVLHRVLEAAHHAPSVGFMQPWDFILIRSEETRRGVHASFERARARERVLFSGARRGLYDRLKLEGIRESPLNVCVTCDRRRGRPVLGRSAVVDADLFSTCLAVQNLWLAARAEGLGVGWVSVLEPEELAGRLGLPAGVLPLAYLCVGYPRVLPDRPELEAAGWRRRLALDRLVHRERWPAGASEEGVR